MFGVFIDFVTNTIIKYKIILADMAYIHTQGAYWFPYIVLLSSNIILVGISSALVLWFAPAGGGSGIPEVKCYLNGIKVPEILRLRTLFVKSVGVILTVSGGLACGNEGPMIHIGSMVAAGISQGKSSTVPLVNTPVFTEFRNDHDKRDFVSGGAAAGIAGAFGAPIGGTLFSLEEGSSFWNQALTWRTFFCAVVAGFTLNTFLSGVRTHNWSPDDTSPSFQITDTSPTYSIPHVPFFILIGALGGILGSIFNQLNKLLMQFRKRINRMKIFRWLEALIIAGITATISFSVCYLAPGCVSIGNSTSTDDITFRDVGWYCGPGEKNQMAALFLGSGELSVKSLFNDNTFMSHTLLIYAVLYYLLSLITLGIAAPSGLLVPCLAVGGAYGRLIGQWLQPIMSDVNVHTFALVGAASFLGGTARMTISLCVILIETTGSVQRGLPIMVTLMVAKWVGDYFIHGIYDIHIELKKIPLLEWDPDHEMSDVRAEEIMADHVIWLYDVEKVLKIHTILQKTTHNGYPIISKDEVFQGLILRSQLVTLLYKRAFQNSKAPEEIPLVDLSEFSKYYPRSPGIESVQIYREDEDKFIDLRPYMNRTPYVIHNNATVERVFRLFRTMGLRHLPVINEKARIVGMITRRDLYNFQAKRNKNKLDRARKRRKSPNIEDVQYIEGQHSLNGISESTKLLSD
eukprot:TRINITY_DN14358_c0_g1_i2.p1 TRINITY_DN14358_c0_g1~~TRINITY_DN14358_c0_g1_i2.p1  ORF type:complete len:769 (-),score=170.70 TRINITY_DN14358_c0_g1_i2:99-2159(-)